MSDRSRSALAVPAGARAPREDRRDRLRRTLPAGILVAVVVLFVLNLSVGAFAIPAASVLRVLGTLIGLLAPDAALDQDTAVLTGIRMPRTVLAVVAGAGLAITGAVLQGLFRNPLADPAVVGVSSGAALGAALAIVGLGHVPGEVRAAVGSYALPVCAFACALLATATVYRFGRGPSGPSLVSMLLAGIAVNAIAFSGVGFLSVIASDEQLRNLTFWNLGSLGGATWPQLAVVCALALPAIMLLLRLAAPLDAMALGLREAHSLGVDVVRTQRGAVLLTALVVGAVVSCTGVIGFVGLVAPHMLRLAMGPGHRALLPATAALGALLLLVADLLARTLFAPAELPVGVLTTAAGAPFFLWLLARSRRGALA